MNFSKKVLVALLVFATLFSTVYTGGIPVHAEEITDYTISFAEDTAVYSASYNGANIKSQTLFVVVNTEDYTYSVANPATAASVYANPLSDGILVYFDAEGIGTKYVGSGNESISYKGASSNYVVKNGKIVTTTSTQYKKLSGLLHQILPTGKIRIFTGVYQKQFYQSGAIVRKKYVLVKKTKDSGVTVYDAINPASSLNNSGTTIYYVNKDAQASVYIGSGIISLYYNGVKKSYYVASGEIVHYASEKMKSISGILYKISKLGRIAKFTGFYNNYLYISGTKKTGEFFALKDDYLYKSDKAGALKLYKTSGTSKYFKLCYTSSGNTVIAKVTPNTASATIYQPATTDKVAYKTVEKRLYAITVSTGNAKPYTGVYNSIYYSSGKRATFKYPVKRISNGYIYTIDKQGNAKKYIRAKAKKTTYRIYVNGKFHYCYYNTGNVYKTLTSVQARDIIVKKAKTYLGYNEKDGSCRKIFNIYNAYRPLPVGVKLKARWNKYKGIYDCTAWCAGFASTVFIASGMSEIMAVECGCERQTMIWKKMGCWIENDKYKPKPGDLIYYSWDAKGTGDWKGRANHVGIVVGYDDDTETILSLEGNTGPVREYGKKKTRKFDGVYTLKIPWNHYTIRGFASPKY